MLIWLLCGAIAGAIGNAKGEGGLGCLTGLIFGPFGILFAIISSGDRVNCPFCQEKIKKKATVCPHCRKDLPART